MTKLTKPTTIKPTTSEVDLLAQLVKMAVPAPAKLKGEASTVERMRAKFAIHAREQIVNMETKTRTKWFSVQQNGVVTIALRNGNTAMTVEGVSYFETPNKEAAVAFLEKAIETVNSGVLDEQLLLTKKQVKQVKQTKTN